MVNQNAEIAVRKSMPNLVSLVMIYDERARMYEDGRKAADEFKERLPGWVMDSTIQVTEHLTKGINPQDESTELLDNRMDNYLASMGPDSLDVAEAIVDPSLDRVERIGKEIGEIFGRLVGDNPSPVLKGKIPFPVYSPGGNLADDERMDRRISDVDHVLARVGKSIADVGEMSLEDIMAIREKVQERRFSFESRELLEQQVSMRYAEHLMSLSENTTPENLKEDADFSELTKVVADNIPEGVSESERKEMLESLDKGVFREVASDQVKLATAYAARSFLTCAITSEYLHGARQLAAIGGVNVLLDGEVEKISTLDYIEFSRRDLTRLSKMKGFLVDTAQERGLDEAVKNETINEGIRFAYGNDRETYVSEQRLKMRLEGSLMQAILRGEAASAEDILGSSLYRDTAGLIDKKVEKQAQAIFG